MFLDIAPGAWTMNAMAATNVDRVRAGYEAVARGDLDVLGQLLAPDVRWHGGDPATDGGCRSREEALAFIRAAIARGAMGRLADVIDGGERVVVVMQPPSADGITPPLRANVTTFSDGQVVEMVAYRSPREALAAVGIEPTPPY